MLHLLTFLLEFWNSQFWEERSELWEINFHWNRFPSLYIIGLRFCLSVTTKPINMTVFSFEENTTCTESMCKTNSSGGFEHIWTLSSIGLCFAWANLFFFEPRVTLFSNLLFSRLWCDFLKILTIQTQHKQKCYTHICLFNWRELHK